MTHLRVLWVSFRLAAITELEYRTNFFIQMLQSLLGLATALAGLGVVFSHTDRLGGWRASELLVLVGIYLLAGGVINLVIQPSMAQFMGDVRQGTLDYTLLKPRDAQYLISVRQIQVWKLLDVALGLGVVVVALVRLGGRIGPSEALAFAVALAAGGIIVYSFWLILATCAFWFVRVENILIIFQDMYQAGRWPVTLYPGWLRLTLTFLVPIAFATTVPSEALTGRLTGGTLATAIVLALALLAGSRWFWLVGLRHYSGASA